MTGHNPHTEPKWFDRYCPVRHVTPEYPPTFLIHGTEDTDVPYAESENMADKLAKAGVQHEFRHCFRRRPWPLGSEAGEKDSDRSARH